MSTKIARSDLVRVFLVGCPRSGTTLLQALLGAHKEVASFPETHIFVKGRRFPARIATGLVARKQLHRFVHEISAVDLYERRRIAVRPQTYQRDLVNLLDTLACQHAKHLWIEKTPNHVLAIPEIRRLVPSSRFVHLIRDGRAVVASLYEVTKQHPETWGSPYTLNRCVSEWNNAIIASSTAMAAGRDGIVVHYGDLTRNPAEQLQRLCWFLGLRYESAMLTAYTDIASSILSTGEEWKDRISAPISDAGLLKYCELFTQEQQKFIERSLVPIPANLRCQ